MKEKEVCSLCRRQVEKDDKEWIKRKHASPLCKRCFGDLAFYGCD